MGISHPKYNEQTMDMDFALLKLEKKIDFSANSHIRPICLPDNVNELYTNAESIVTGWGTTSSGGSASSTLQEVMVKVILVDLWCLPRVMVSQLDRIMSKSE